MSEVRDEISRSIKLKKDWLLGFLVGNIILYSCLLPLIGFSSINGPLFSVMIIIIYGAVETILFFGCKQYSWPVSVTFRVLIGIHDFILFLVYAVLAVQGPNKYERCVEYRYYSDSGYQESEEMKHFSIKDSFLFNFTKIWAEWKVTFHTGDRKKEDALFFRLLVVTAMIAKIWQISRLVVVFCLQLILSWTWL